MTTKNTAIKALNKKLEEARIKHLASMDIYTQSYKNKESEVYQKVCYKSYLENDGFVNGLLEAIEIVQAIKED